MYNPHRATRRVVTCCPHTIEPSVRCLPQDTW